MPKTRCKPALPPTLFDPISTQPQWQDLPPRIRQQLMPLLIQRLRNHAVRKPARTETGGADE